jgi:hypothetical protein
LDFISSGILESNSSFFTKAFIPASFLYRVRIGTGGIRSSFAAAWQELHIKVPNHRKGEGTQDKKKKCTEGAEKNVNWAIKKMEEQVKHTDMLKKW